MDYNEIRHKIEKEAKKRYIKDIEDLKKTVDRHYKLFIVYHVITFGALLTLEFFLSKSAKACYLFASHYFQNCN